jgi:hypothetical protein
VNPHNLHGPDVGRSGLQPVVDLDVTAGGGLYPREFESQVLGVRCAPRGEEQVRPLEDRTTGGLRQMQCDFDAGDAFNPSDAGAGQDVDAFSVKELLEGLRDVGIFAMGEYCVRRW